MHRCERIPREVEAVLERVEVVDGDANRLTDAGEIREETSESGRSCDLPLLCDTLHRARRVVGQDHGEGLQSAKRGGGERGEDFNRCTGYGHYDRGAHDEFSFMSLLFLLMMMSDFPLLLKLLLLLSNAGWSRGGCSPRGKTRREFG